MGDVLMWIFIVLVFIAVPVLGKYLTKHTQKRTAAERAKREEASRTTAEQPGEQAPPTVTEEIMPFTLSEKLVPYKCGHEYAEQFGCNFYGERAIVPPEALQAREKCGDCLLAEVRPHIIRCAVCGFAIMPGDPVAAYGSNPAFNKHWITRTRDGRGVIGCLRWDCCPSGGFMAGHWTTQGLRPLFAGGATAMEHVMRSGEAILVNNNDDGTTTVTPLREALDPASVPADDDAKK